MLPAVIVLSGLLCVLAGLLLARASGGGGRPHGRHASLVPIPVERRSPARRPGRHVG